MRSENAIEVRNITKSFKVYQDKGHTLKEKALFSKRREYEVRKVIDGISFDVKKGEAVGLIGHNGCGKSTTLKMLTKIMYPDSGSIEMKGRVSSLIELGAGFHPDMSGRENIYINASIFGLTSKEIDERIEDIIAFSELEEYINNPVRTYSSGMYMRLAFSVAINVDADILLIDEILGVGDAGFQAKCFEKLKKIKANGTTIVIVSHALGQIEQICEKSYWIHEGKIKLEGRPRDVHPAYLEYMAEERKRIAEKEQQRREISEDKITQNRYVEKNEQKSELPKENNRWGTGDIRIERVKMSNKEEKLSFITGEYATIEIDYKVYKKVIDAVIGIAIFRADGIHCYGINTNLDRLPNFNIDRNGNVKIIIEEWPLLPGEYTMDVAIESMGMPIDYWKSAVTFNIFSKDADVGIVKIKHSWMIGGEE